MRSCTWSLREGVAGYIERWTCNKWAKWRCLSVDIRILSTKGCLPLPRGYIHWSCHWFDILIENMAIYPYKSILIMLKSLWKHACITGSCCSFMHVLYISELKWIHQSVYLAKAKPKWFLTSLFFFWSFILMQGLLFRVYNNIFNVYASQILHWSLENLPQTQAGCRLQIPSASSSTISNTLVSTCRLQVISKTMKL